MPPGTGASHLFSDSDELFLQSGEDQFICVFQYGVVAFFNHNSSEINAFVKQLNPARNCAGLTSKDQELSETSQYIDTLEAHIGRSRDDFHRTVRQSTRR